MSSKPALINLVKGKHKSFFDRFLAWALSAGRVIIIVTEIIALSAFLYRFSLDREIIDLRDNTKQEQKILELFKEQEKTFRNLQERLSCLKNRKKRLEIFRSDFHLRLSWHLPQRETLGCSLRLPTLSHKILPQQVLPSQQKA